MTYRKNMLALTLAGLILFAFTSIFIEGTIINDFEPPTVQIISPEPFGLYPAGCTEFIEFYVIDDIDEDVHVEAYLTDFYGDQLPTCSGGLLPQLSGVYTLVAEAADDAGNLAVKEVTFIVFDPYVGFTTGGGWIVPEPDVGEKATFGFVSKYKKGSHTPDGNLEFQYQYADLNLKSSQIDWMTISNNKAIFQGVATINGEGYYTFRVQATDGGLTGDQPDHFHLKVWYETDTEADPVYDYKGDLEGGNIVVHKKVDLVDIGVTAPSDGSLETYSALVSMAETDINKYCVDNSLSYRFKFHLVSNQGSGEVALENTVWFDEQGINLIVGHGWSGQCEASLEYVNANDMLLLSPSSTARSLCIPEDNLYRLAACESKRAVLLAKLQQFLGKEAVVILNSEDKTEMRDLYISQAEEIGLEILGRYTYEPYSGEFSYYGEIIDGIFANSGYSENELALQIFSGDQWEPLDESHRGEYEVLTDVDWFSDAVYDPEDVRCWLGDEAANVKMYHPEESVNTDSPEYVAVQERYFELTGDVLGLYDSILYDCYRVMAQSIINADSAETQDVIGALELLVEDYRGASGVCTFDEDGDRSSSNYDIFGYHWVDYVPQHSKHGGYDCESDSFTWENIPDGEPPGRATLEFSKDLTIRGEGDHLSSGDHLANVSIQNEVKNNDDLLNDELGGLEFLIRAEGIIDVDEGEYATWDSTYAHWIYPPEHTIPENDNTWVNAHLDHQEVARSLWSIDRWVDQEEFTSNGYQEAVFTVTFDEIDETSCHIDTESDENVKTEFLLESFWTDAPIEFLRIFENLIEFDFISDEIEIGKAYTFRVTTQITILQDFVTWVRIKPQIGVRYNHNEEQIIVETLQTEIVAPDYMLPSLVSEIRASTNVPNIWYIRRFDNTSAALNNVFEYSDP